MSFNDALSNLLPKGFGKQPERKSNKNETAEQSDIVEEDVIEDLDPLRSMVPMSFGKQKKEVDMSAYFEKSKRTVEGKETLMHSTRESKAKDSEEEMDSEEEEEEEEEEREITLDEMLPISHEIKLKDHYKTVSALALDPAGARLITGGYDYDVKFWDFSGMDSSLRPFRSLEPCGGHQIHDLQYSITGDQFLIMSGSASAKLYDRDGFEIVEYMKGDPYLRDMRHTSGHVAALTSCAWHPSNKETFITASADSTIRIWDVEDKRKQKQVICFKSKNRGGRSPITACNYSHDGKLIVGAAQDGSLNLWSTNSSFARPTHSLSDAHMQGSETSSAIFSKDNHTVVTRGGDDTVKIWDIRNFKSPLNTAKDLTTYNAETNVIFSPDEKLVITGTGVKKNEGYGKVVMMDRNTLEVVRTMSVSQSSVVRVLWHSRINQIITGSGDGTVSVFYDPNTSVRGAKLCVVKEPKARSVDDYEINRPILTPHALPMFKDDQPRTNQRKREKLRKDPVASRRPDLPVKGPGRGGKVGANLTQHIMRDLVKDTSRDEDPREAFLKHAKDAEEDPYWVAPAYKKHQPNPVFDKNKYDEDEMPRRQ
ncbi:WD40 repeat-like protein [Basidiobolus meristosporus CBS 931.73]|uniref:WD40 repeat-like protein n=1 Tax=Basidiobolus meristosporus CBS 931.73 TaxID=1314790 RepID=A0A1Y1XRP0_9FUNG|nr:WD40 repeat-like protein [Basidiobolus meristosporus CBS 931.73]|eukprot:ORX88421.1 WD40 repeat-like protein [Basidiobolus meristosporus CBS 931.73]